MNNIKVIIVWSVLLIAFWRNNFAIPQKSGRNTDGKDREGPMMDYEAKAKLIARLVFFCEWPADINIAGPDALLTIGAFEKNDIIDFLIEETKTKKFAGKHAKIIIIEDDEIIKTCNLLFIDDVSKKRLKKILEIVEDLPVLTVSDTRGYAERGVMINLFTSGNKLAFNLNYTNLKKSGLHLPSRVLSVAEKLF